MNKITVFVVTACVLLGLFLQLPAQQQMDFKINIAVQDVNGARTIDMGGKYACVVPPGATIKWLCDYDFLLEFQADAPFDDADQSDEVKVPNKKMIKKKARSNAELNRLHKYTVFIVDGGNQNTPLILDPIIVIIPPGK